MRNTHILLAAGLAMTPAALMKDVAVSKVAGGSDYAYYGTSASKVAYSLADLLHTLATSDQLDAEQPPGPRHLHHHVPDL
ncbi:MAG: hypothetical protein R3E96_12760 [Planctomycetota bacterium]